VEFGVEIVSTAAWSGCRGACFNTFWRSGRPPSGVSKRTTSRRTRFERLAERRLRRRLLTEDGNVEITGRDLRDGSAPAPASTGQWR
jgi:hypothetical protein